MKILPRDAKPDDRMRAPIAETNRLIEQRFAAGGSLPSSLFPCKAHPSDAGYEAWADALIQAGIKP